MRTPAVAAPEEPTRRREATESGALGVATGDGALEEGTHVVTSARSGADAPAGQPQEIARNCRGDLRKIRFTAAIDQCLDNLATVHKGEMATLLTHKFQMFEDVPLLAA
jgi:hypothetical protein